MVYCPYANTEKQHWHEWNEIWSRSGVAENRISPISDILFQIAKLLVRAQTLFLLEVLKRVVSDVFTERAEEFICTLQRTSSSI